MSPTPTAPGPAPPAPPAWRGVAWMVLATMLFVVLDSLAKHLTARYPVGEVVWARFFFHLVFVAAILGPRLPAVARSKRVGLQLLRSAFILGANGSAFTALRTMKLVDVSAILFTAPLFVTALAVPLLGERVGARRWAAVAVGLAGALVVIRPGAGVLDSVALLPLGAAIAFALYQIITRRISMYDASMTTLLYTPVIGTLASSAALPLWWRTPDAAGWAMFAAAGVLGALGQLCLIRAIAAAPLPVVAPFNYLVLVWATLSGVVFFGNLPDRFTVIGASIIVASGLYVLWREHVRARARRAGAAS